VQIYIIKSKIIPKIILYIPNATKVNLFKKDRNSFIVMYATTNDTINPIRNGVKFAFSNSE
jgi:hypothetical protein